MSMARVVFIGLKIYKRVRFRVRANLDCDRQVERVELYLMALCYQHDLTYRAACNLVRVQARCCVDEAGKRSVPSPREAVCS